MFIDEPETRLGYNHDQKSQLTFGGTFHPVRLRMSMSVQMVQRAVSLLAALPSAFVPAFNIFIAATGTLVLHNTWGHERVVLRQWLRELYAGLSNVNGRI